MNESPISLFWRARTFDVSVIEMMSGLLEVKASTGNSHLGGEDFDWKIVDWLADSPTFLHDEARKLLERAQSLLKESTGKERTRIKKLITSLQEATASEDVERLQVVIDEATDTLIDLEL